MHTSFFWYKNALDTFPSIVSCFTRKKPKAEKQANTKTISLPLWKCSGAEKAIFQGTALELLEWRIPKRIVSTIKSFPQALKNWKQTSVKTNNHPPSRFNDCHYPILGGISTNTKRQLSKQNVCLSEATINVNTCHSKIKSDVNPLTEMKMKTL